MKGVGLRVCIIKFVVFWIFKAFWKIYDLLVRFVVVAAKQIQPVCLSMLIAMAYNAPIVNRRLLETPKPKAHPINKFKNKDKVSYISFAFRHSPKKPPTDKYFFSVFLNFITILFPVPKKIIHTQGLTYL